MAKYFMNIKESEKGCLLRWPIITAGKKALIDACKFLKQEMLILEKGNY